MSTNSNTQGGYLKETMVQKNIVDALRAHTKVLSLGTQFLSGLKFTRVFPVEANISGGFWVAGENTGVDVTASDGSFAARSLSPHSLQCTTSISRQLLGQSSSDLDRWIDERIAKAHALSLDSASILGTGNLGQPVGLLQTTGIGSVAVGSNGGAPTSDIVNALESTVALANGDDATMGFLTNSTMRSKLRKTSALTSAYSGVPLWAAGKLLDTPAAVSNQIPANLVKGSSSDCSAIICGAWDQFLIGEFNGALEIISDPYALAKQGMIEITSFAMYDCLVLQPAAFAACLDARNV